MGRRKIRATLPFVEAQGRIFIDAEILILLLRAAGHTKLADEMQTNIDGWRK